MESCNNPTCVHVKEIYERQYANHPQMLELLKKKMENWKQLEGVPCGDEVICLPLLQIISRMEER